MFTYGLVDGGRQSAAASHFLKAAKCISLRGLVERAAASQVPPQLQHQAPHQMSQRVIEPEAALQLACLMECFLKNAVVELVE